MNLAEQKKGDHACKENGEVISANQQVHAAPWTKDGHTIY